jgi:PAS domain S-box-containing protein
VGRLPELFDLRVKARSLAYLFVAGAALGVLTLAFPHAALIRDGPLIILAAIATAMGLVLYTWADRMREWQLHVALAGGTVILTLANYYVEATVLYPLIYTWTGLYAFYFFRLRVALAHMALIGVGYAIVLVLVDPPGPVVRWLLAVGTPLIAGILISRLLSRLRAEARESDARARALRESEARTRLVLDAAPDAFLTLDRDGVIMSWNSAAERLFGWTAAEAIGVPMRSLIVPPEFRERHDSRRRSMIDAPQVVATERFDVEFTRRDGSRFPGEAVVSKIEIKGEPFVSGFIRDVSERLRRQEEREALLREQAARAEAERVAEMVSRMTQLVDVALQHRSLESMLIELVVEVRSVLGADAATIFLAEGDELRVGASSTGSDREADVQPFAFGLGFAGNAAATRQPTMTHDVDASTLMDPGLRSLDVSSLIAVPLLAENNVIGVLEVCAVAPKRFAATDLTMLRLAADRVALAMLHAGLYEREHRIAETLQRSLLPERLPSLPGLEVAARYRPAAAEAEVGGDWFDVIQTAAGTVGLVMGDVAGKGLSAASLVGRLRSALRAYAYEGHEPARVVEQLNRLLWTEGGESQMATLLYAVVDPGEGTVKWVNAGHLAPLMAADGEQPRFLEGAASVPLGVLPFPDYEQAYEAMRPGNTIVLFTDGLIERPGEHIDEGLRRLAERFEEVPPDAEQICTHLLSTLVPTGGAQDDVAILALRSLPVADAFEVEFPTEPEALAQLRSLLRRWLRYAGVADTEIAEITTACGEAATNAIEHAGAGSPFVVSGRLDNGSVELSVSDRGEWRPAREGDQGRGIALMRALMDSVEVTPSAEGTTVRMRRAMDRGGGLG